MPELTRRRSPDSRKMPLTRGGTAGYDARRMTFFEFTMIDGRAQVVGCEISSTAMDELASSKGTMPADREDQFLRLQDRIERVASDVFDEMGTSSGKVRIFYHHVRQREPR